MHSVHAPHERIVARVDREHDVARDQSAGTLVGPDVPKARRTPGIPIGTAKRHQTLCPVSQKGSSNEATRRIQLANAAVQSPAARLPIAAEPV